MKAFEGRMQHPELPNKRKQDHGPIHFPAGPTRGSEANCPHWDSKGSSGSPGSRLDEMETYNLNKNTKDIWYEIVPSPTVNRARKEATAQ